MNRASLFEQIRSKQSYLCVGLDSDLEKIPPHLLQYDDPIFEFNRRIIEATLPYAVAYKPNIAFYEALGAKGWESLEKTLACIPSHIFTIADAKRGDIGNTSGLYAKAFFEKLSFDAITVAPYMGADSVQPFLAFEGKWVILLALTSNTGSQDFQQLPLASGKALYEAVIERSGQWASAEQLMYVVGATQAAHIAHIRRLIPEHFLLVPGVGAQGGDLAALSEAGLNAQGGLLVNSSREILYASSGEDFAEQAARKAAALQEKMAILLQNKGLLS